MSDLSRRLTLSGLALSGLAAAGLAGPARAASAPRRVVSLNPCLDVILLAVADRDQIAALSHYARQVEASTIADQARTLPFTWESAEEVIGLRPDLVLTARHSSPATRNALRRLKVATELFGVPDSVAESLDQVRQIARLVGREDRGRQVVARIEAALDAGRAPAGFKPIQALVYQPNGLAAGAGTLMDELMTRAGFVNVAGRYGLKKWGNVGLEKLLADPPQALLAGVPSAGGRSFSERVMTHPALKALSGRMVQAVLPEKLLYCGGPVMIETAKALATARRKVLEEMA